jgi:hypothetical protein
MFFNEVRPFLGSEYIYETIDDLGRLEIGRSLISEATNRGWMVPDSSSRGDTMRLQAAPKYFKFGQTEAQVNLLAKNISMFSKRVIDLRTNPWPKLLRSLKRRRRLNRSKRDEMSVATCELPDKYLFMELQPQPNGTTLRKGWMYPNQKEAIASIASNLPVGYSLLVRESPRQWSRGYLRRTNYWSEIGSLPNVYVADPRLDVLKLVKGATAIVETSYSTLAFESLFLPKPLLVLGLTHLRGIDGVVIAEDFESFKDAVDEVFKFVENPMTISEITESVSDFVIETQSSTLEGSLAPADVPISTDELNRITQNTAATIAVWYLRQEKQSS